VLVVLEVEAYAELDVARELVNARAETTVTAVRQVARRPISSRVPIIANGIGA
jgi:hypothetical protein